MKLDFLEPIFKGILDFFNDIWENGYMIYFIIALFLFIILIAFFNRDLLSPVNLFD